MYNCPFLLQVFYMGKLRMSTRRAPVTFIDDAIDKFRNHELEQQHKKVSSVAEEGAAVTVTVTAASPTPILTPLPTPSPTAAAATTLVEATTPSIGTLAEGNGPLLTTSFQPTPTERPLEVNLIVGTSAKEPSSSTSTYTTTSPATPTTTPTDRISTTARASIIPPTVQLTDDDSSPFQSPLKPSASNSPIVASPVFKHPLEDISASFPPKQRTPSPSPSSPSTVDTTDAEPSLEGRSRHPSTGDVCLVKSLSLPVQPMRTRAFSTGHQPITRRQNGAGANSSSPALTSNRTMLLISKYTKVLKS